MRNPLFLAILLSCGAWSAAAEKPAPSPTPQAPVPTLRARLYDVAGALGNDGFKVRDGAWAGILEGGKTQRLPVNLFAGNQYWFCAATSAPGEDAVIVLRDPTGQPVDTVSYRSEGIAAHGVTAPVTGLYTLELKGAYSGTRDFCLLYLFK